jgi:hypothetical protein
MSSAITGTTPHHFLLIVHSWDFNIADKTSVSIGEGHVLGLITA